MQRAAHGRDVHMIKYIRTAHPHGLPVRGDIIRSRFRKHSLKSNHAPLTLNREP